MIIKVIILFAVLIAAGFIICDEISKIRREIRLFRERQQQEQEREQGEQDES